MSHLNLEEFKPLPIPFDREAGVPRSEDIASVLRGKGGGLQPPGFCSSLRFLILRCAAPGEILKTKTEQP